MIINWLIINWSLIDHQLIINWSFNDEKFQKKLCCLLLKFFSAAGMFGKEPTEGATPAAAPVTSPSSDGSAKKVDLNADIDFDWRIHEGKQILSFFFCSSHPSAAKSSCISPCFQSLLLAACKLLRFSVAFDAVCFRVFTSFLLNNQFDVWNENGICSQDCISVFRNQIANEMSSRTWLAFDKAVIIVHNARLCDCKRLSKKWSYGFEILEFFLCEVQLSFEMDRWSLNNKFAVQCTIKPPKKFRDVISGFSTRSTRSVIWFGLVRSHWLIWCRADQCSLCIFWLSHHLTLDKSNPSTLKKIGNYLEKILGCSERAKDWDREPGVWNFPVVRKPQQWLLDGSPSPVSGRTSQPSTAEASTVKKIKRIQQTYCNHTEIDFALTWNEKKPIDPGLIRVRFAASCHHSANERQMKIKPRITSLNYWRFACHWEEWLQINFFLFTFVITLGEISRST